MKVAGPFVGMMMAECAQVGLMIVSKQVMSQGMISFIFVLYSNALASLVLLPSSLILHRSGRPPLYLPNSLRILRDGFVRAFGYAGINLSSPTLATAVLNLVPGFTFVLAVTFRMEKLDWRTSSTIAKAAGTVVSMAGAFIMTCYNGPPLIDSTPDSSKLVLLQSNWALEGSFLAVDCVMASCFVIIQALILKKYPAELIIVFFYCFFVAILSTVVCLVMERDFADWSLKPRIRWMRRPLFRNIRICLPSWCYCMVSAQDRAGFRVDVQAHRYRDCSFGWCHLLWRYSVPWKVGYVKIPTCCDNGFGAV